MLSRTLLAAASDQISEALLQNGFIDLVEEAVSRVAAQCELWPEAPEALRHFLTFDVPKLSENDNVKEIKARIRSLIDQLEPLSVEARVRSLVTEMSWDYLLDDAETDHEQLHHRQVDAVREFAAELLEQPNTLKSLLPQLNCQGAPTNGRMPKRMTYTFGNAIAGLSKTPIEWLEPIAEALRDLPQERRDFDLLAGYLAGLPGEYAATVETFKQRAAGDRNLAAALPLICWHLGIVASDIESGIVVASCGSVTTLAVDAAGLAAVRWRLSILGSSPHSSTRYLTIAMRVIASHSNLWRCTPFKGWECWKTCGRNSGRPQRILRGGAH